MVSIALQAAANPAIHTNTSNAGAIGILVIYAVGVVAIVGMIAYFKNEETKDEEKRRRR